MPSKYTALTGLLILAALYAATSLGYLGPNPIGSTDRATEPLIVPLSYAFAIWGPIYLGLLIFPIYQLLKDNRDDPRWDKVRNWYSANVVANGVWLVLASYDATWSTVAVIAFMLYSLLRINVLLDELRAAGEPVNYWAEVMVFRVYFGWVTLATVLNVAVDLKSSGWDGGSFGEVNWTVVMMIVAAAIAGLTAWRFRSIPYALVIAWAFLGIALKHYNSFSILFTTALIIIMVFTAMVVRLVLKRRATA